MNQTTGTIKVVCHDGEGNNSLANNIQALLYEGDDDYDHITTYGKETMQELEDLAANGMTVVIESEDGTTKTHHVDISILEGGDLKWLNATCGLFWVLGQLFLPLVLGVKQRLCNEQVSKDAGLRVYVDDGPCYCPWCS